MPLPAQPEPAQPASAQPASAQPEAAQPASAQPASAQPEAAQPASAQPEPAQPGSSQSASTLEPQPSTLETQSLPVSPSPAGQIAGAAPSTGAADDAELDSVDLDEELDDPEAGSVGATVSPGDPPGSTAAAPSNGSTPPAPVGVLGGGPAAPAPVSVLGGGPAAPAPVSVLGGGAPRAAPVSVLGGGPPAAGGTSRIVATPQGPRVVGPGVRVPTGLAAAALTPAAGPPAPAPPQPSPAGPPAVARPQPVPQAAAGARPAAPGPLPATAADPATQAAIAAAQAAQAATQAMQAAQAMQTQMQAAQAMQAVQAMQSGQKQAAQEARSKSSDRLRPAGPRTQRRTREPGQGLPILPLAGVGVAFGALVAFAIVQANKPRPTTATPPPAVTQPLAPPPPLAPATPAGGGVLPDDPLPDLRRGRDARGFEQWLALAHEEAARAWKIVAAGRAAAAKSRLEEARKRFVGASAPAAALAVLDGANEAMGGAPPAGAVPPHFSTEGLEPRASETAPPPTTTEESTEVVAVPVPSTESKPTRRPPPRPIEPGRATESAPSRPEGPDEGEYAEEGSARALLYEVYEKTWTKDPAGARKAYESLLAGDPESPEVLAGMGFMLSQEGKYAAALAFLKRVGSKAGPQAVRDRAFAALYLGQLEEVRVLLDDPALEGGSFRQVVDGPFKERFPNASRVLEETTDDGHYRVVSDLGLSAADLSQLETKLAATEGAARMELEVKLRRQHRGLQELLDTMTKAYKAYDKLFGIERPGEVVPTVFVFSDRQPFDAFSRALGVGATENTLGYYWPPYRILVFYDQEEGRRRGWLLSKGTLETLLHETFHQWLDIYVADAPRWFDEGLAEYFGISELTKTELRYGLVPDRHPSRLDNIRSAFIGDLPKPLPLDRLLTTEHEQFMSPRQAAVNYAHAWSFVHFLGSNPGGQRILRDYFQALRSGKSITAAYQQVFGKLDIKAVEKEWREYVGKLR